MKVFIENEAGSNLKNLHNEKTLEYQETLTVSRPYPFPYGFILDTDAEDGDNIDVFVITNQSLKRGDIINCKIIGLMEQFEKPWNSNVTKDKEEIDHNILAIPQGEKMIKLSEDIQFKLTDFVHHVFDNIRLNKTRVGQFLDKKAGLKYMNNE